MLTARRLSHAYYEEHDDAIRLGQQALGAPVVAHLLVHEREQDCGTDDALETTALIEAGEIVEPLGERILGRVALEDVLDPSRNVDKALRQTRIDTTDGRSYSEATIDGVVNIAHRLNNLVARGMLS